MSSSEDGARLEAALQKKGEALLSKQSSGKLGASKGLGFNQSAGERKTLKFNMESLKNLKRLSQVGSTKNSQKGLRGGAEEYFARKGRLTSSNIPWTTRAPLNGRAEGDAEAQLKFSDLGGSGGGDPASLIKEKSLREKYRLEQIEQWKREHGGRKAKGAFGKVPAQFGKKLEGGFGALAGKEGLGLYSKARPKVKANTPGSFSGALNLKNFSSNTQMYNYGNAGHSNLNFSKNKFNMKPRFTNFGAKPEKFFAQSRNLLRSTDHLMPEISKKSGLTRGALAARTARKAPARGPRLEREGQKAGPVQLKEQGRTEEEPEPEVSQPLQAP